MKAEVNVEDFHRERSERTVWSEMKMMMKKTGQNPHNSRTKQEQIRSKQKVNLNSGAKPELKKVNSGIVVFLHSHKSSTVQCLQSIFISFASLFVSVRGVCGSGPVALRMSLEHSQYRE